MTDWTICDTLTALLRLPDEEAAPPLANKIRCENNHFDRRFHGSKTIFQLPAKKTKWRLMARGGIKVFFSPVLF